MAQEKRYVEVLLPLKMKEPLTYRLPSGWEADAGTWVQVPLRGHPALGVVTEVRDSAPAGVNLSSIEPVAALPDHPAVTPEELSFWQSVADYYMCTIGEVFRAACNLGMQRAILRPAPPRKRKEKKVQPPPASFTLKDLSESQQEALGQVKEGFGSKKPVLLHGATGSGKTELYIHLAAEQLQAGCDVLYLVPEIAISKQLQQRLEEVFGSALKVYHSGNTVPQRMAVIDSLRSDPTPRIILGTRSAVFLPFRKLGLVVVDEEHDRSYKQDDTAPRYNGRDAALMLAAQRGADIVLGSATPSYEALYNVETRKFAKVELPGRYHGGEDPFVEIVDTNRARRLGNMEGSFSRKVLKEMAATLDEGKQVMVFRSRRAYAPVVQCDACGEPARCPRCNVALSYHKFNNTLSCHYCGYHRSFTMRCPSCKEPALQERGAGTEKLEEELREKFPDRVIARFDADTTASRTEQERLLRDFAEGRIDILVGTQMITKGFDFERLALVVVVSADSLFAVPDFRSDERAFQLLVQLMGRSGRRGERGKIIVQTAQPEHPVLQRLLNPGQAPERPSGLLAERKVFAYPPYVRMICITVKDKYEGRVWNVCRVIAEAAGEVGISDLAGPISPAVDLVAGEHIAQIWIKLPRTRALAGTKRALYGRLDAIERDFKGHTRILVDVDPS